MNMVEALMGGLVFTLSSTCSLQIYGSSARWAAASEQRQQVVAAVDSALLNSAVQLAASGTDPAASDCAATAADLAADWIEPSQQGSGAGPALPNAVTRTVQQTADPADANNIAELLLVKVEPAGSANPANAVPARQRLLHPAAFGLCGPEH